MARVRGFTLIEMLLALSIALILFSLAVPALQPLWRRHQLDVKVNRVIASLRYARYYAIRSGQLSYVCGSSEGKLCDGAWAKGLLVKDGNDRVIRYFDLAAKKIEMFWQGNLGKDQRIAWRGDGYPFGQHGHFQLCDRLGVTSRSIFLSRAGHVRVTAGFCDSPS